MSVQKHTVAADGKLQGFLLEVLAGAKVKRVKQLLEHRAVTVNGEVVTRGNVDVKAGDQVTIQFGAPRKAVAGGLRVVYEDDEVIVVDKPPGLLTIATDRERERTAYAYVTEYVRPARVFIVHRLDQGTSGLVLLAKTEATKRALQDGWKDVVKRYHAVVEGVPSPAEGVVRSHLAENSEMNMYSTSDGTGDLAVTRYRVLRSGRGRALVEVTLETGRKNQIRVHMSDLGHPVVGDRKYGARTDPVSRLALHAAYLSFTHPASGERMVMESALPPRLASLVS